MGLVLELGPNVIRYECKCCRRPLYRIWGSVTKDDETYAVYSALLGEHEEGRREAGITVSVGEWWDDSSLDRRQWCHIHAAYEKGELVLTVGAPEESNFFPWQGGGAAMSRAEVLASPLKADFFELCEYLNRHDPAIRSFLSNQEVSGAGRTEPVQ